MEDVIVIGGGAAGLTAALYAARRALRVLVVSQDVGGQASMTADIENYPGFDHVDGLELMERFRRQAERFGAKVRIEEARSVARRGDDFIVTTSVGRYETHAIILAFGLTHKHLGIPGEEALVGRGVSYCATCDAPLFRQRRVAVVGGGNSALDAALLLRKLDAEVHLLTKNDELRGERVLINRVQADRGIDVRYGVHPTAVHGTDRVTGLSLARADGVTERLDVDGIFVEIGFTVNSKLIEGLVDLDDRKQVVIDDTNGTSVPGLFAAGDVTTIGEKQVVISAGEGAKAGLAAHRYLQARGLKPRGVPTDWGMKTPLHVDRTTDKQTV